MTAEKAAIRINHMRRGFPDATVTGYEDLIPAMTNDPKDRHVLAAAVRADAAVIVTATLADFPSTALAPYDLDTVHPNEFLLDQLDLYPAHTLQCLAQQIAAYRNPKVTTAEFLARFKNTVPRFARAIHTQHPPLPG